MHFYREALIYFKLFKERYPKSSLIPRARYWQARTLTEVGRLNEAIVLYKEVINEKEEDLKIMGLKGLGEVYAVSKKYRLALATYEKIMAKFPKHYFDDLELLINLGRAYFHVGKEQKGRKQLFYFLNLAEESPRRSEILFDIAESYYRQGDNTTSQKLYEKVIDEGETTQRAVILALFRRAEYLDDPKHKLSAWQKRGDLTDPAGDRPYLAVLDSYHTEPIAQDARYGLFQRYKVRENLELAFETGKSFLRNDIAEQRAKSRAARLGEILIQMGLVTTEKVEDALTHAKRTALKRGSQ